MKKPSRALPAIWLPFAVTCTIMAGSMLLYGCILHGQKSELARTVSAVRDPAAIGVISMPSIQAATSPTGYTVVPEEPSLGDPVPSVGEIGCMDAAGAAVSFIEKLFGVSLEGTVLQTRYDKYEGMDVGSYAVTVYAGTAPESDASLFYASVNARTGAVLFASRNIFTGEQSAPPLTDGEINAIFDRVMADPTYADMTRALVETHLAKGRMIAEVLCSAVQWAFSDGAETIVDYAVRMSEGECYNVSYTTPDDQLYSVTVYPLGWHSCLWGYQDASEAAEYPSLEEMELQAGPIVQAAYALYGAPYRRGGRSADGLDETGFIRLCVEAVGVRLPLGGLGSISACDGETFIKIDNPNELLPGDVLFFKDSGGAITGAGILISGDMFHYVSKAAGKVSDSTLDETPWHTSFAYGMRIPKERWQSADER